MKLIKYFISISSLFVFISCAQVIPLSGGPKDNTAPKVVKTIPENNSCDFKSNSVSIEFDEYIQLKDLADQFLMNPLQRESPEVEARGKKLFIRFRDSLKENTTYTLNFGNAICDLHENNPLRNFSYSFSTAKTMDTLRFVGNTFHVMDGKQLSNVFIGLYQSLDSYSFNYPEYSAYSDANGTFQIDHLPNKVFYVLAFTDKNKNKLFDSNELLSFSTEKINFFESVKLPLALPDFSSPLVRKTEWVHEGKARVCYTSPVVNFNVVDESKRQLHCSKNISGDSVYVYFDTVFQDTTRFFVIRTKTIDSLSLVTNNNKKTKNLNEKPRILPAQLLTGKIMPCSELTFSVNRNYTSLNKDAFMLIQSGDTIENTRYKIISSAPDSIRLLFDFSPSNSYRLIFFPTAILGFQNNSNDTTVFSFSVKNQEEISTLTAQVSIRNEGCYIFQLLTNNQNLIQKKTICTNKNNATEKIVFSNLNSGDYIIRVIYDSDKNNNFSSFSLEKFQKAEKVFLYEKPIQIPEGWESEINFVLD